MALNRAIALGELEGPAVALAAVEPLDLDGYYLFHATRGDLRGHLGRVEEAGEAWERAILLTQNVAEQHYLQGRRDSLRHVRLHPLDES